uniref:Anthranilate N-benzoyltransferase protein 2 n=1 Tax=Cajanus cajan TaxID=3821 RepID=A0A151SGA0_CAJCA|nr:Anthranilate N-benzoyltransferase protein 2 [Cajanus cajan]
MEPLWLSDSDQIGHLGHVSTIYIYKAKHSGDIIETMKNSLSKILVPYYPIAGRLRLTESGRMEVDCNAKGVTLIEAETTNRFGDYKDFSPSESTKELVPEVDYTQPMQELPLLLLQLTKFHGGEGLALGVVVSHPLTDGIALTHFINTWAKLARGETPESNEIPFLDRKLLKLPNQSAPSVDLPEWKPVPKIPAGLEQNKRSAALLKLTSSQVKKLKMANNESMKEGARPYSTFEVISAHIWRCASKAREIGENQPTLVRFSVDIRNRLIPPLPQNYFGNALAKTVTPKCCVGDIISNPLCHASQKIREAVYVVTNEYIRSQLCSTLGQEQLDYISKGVPYSGSHNILLTSWISMPVYEADFGWGKPVHFGLAHVSQEDRAMITRSSDGDGVVVSMHFQTSQMQLFKKFFYHFMRVSLL